MFRTLTIKIYKSSIALFLLLLTLSGCVGKISGNSNDSARAVRLKTQADMYYRSQHYIEALETYTKAMDVARKSGDSHTQLLSMANIGMINDVFGDYKRALYYYQKVIEKAQNLDDQEIKAKVLASAVVSACNGGELELAKKLYEKQKKSPQSDKCKNTYSLLTNAALIAGKERRYQEAIRYGKQTIRFVEAEQMGDASATPILLEVGTNYMHLDLLDSALVYYKRCEALSVNNKLDGYQADVYDALAQLYTAMGKKHSAEIYNNKYEQLKDSIFSTPRFNDAKDKLLKVEDRANTEQISGLADTVRNQTIVIAVISILLVAVIILATIIYRQQKIQEKSYALLIDKDQQLVSLESERGETKEVPQILHMSREQSEELITKIKAVLADPQFIYSPDFSRDSLCKQVGSNTTYVSAAINEYYKKTFKTLLNELRIREATRRLSNPESDYQNMEQLALSLGYNSASNFIAAFKKNMGMTPAVYRKLSLG